MNLAAGRTGLDRRRDDVAAVTSGRSPLAIRFFGSLFERDLRSSFHAVRCAGEVPAGSGPLVVFANHPSWWDGEIFVWLSRNVFGDRRGFAPIEAAMLERYPFFRKLGAFGVARGYRGAAAFLAVGETVLRLEDGLLLVNAEGRFRDVRDRPLSILPGLAHLAQRVPSARFVPLAIEYAFWDERRPNLLLRFGAPVAARAMPNLGVAALQDALATTMDLLAEDARSRDPKRFTTLLAGRTAINPIYDSWRRLRAAVHGRRFDPAHRTDPNRQ